MPCRQGPNLFSNRSSLTKNVGLVVVPVAQSRALRVEDVPDTDIRSETPDVNGGVESKGVARDVSAANSGDTGVATVVLPDTEVAVNKSVVQEEDWVGG